MKCRHMEKSGEAYIDGKPADVTICAFPDNEPGRFVDAPRWLLRQIGGGLAITPERDCIGCPAFKSAEPGD